MTETSCTKTTPALLSPWRRLCQWGTTLLLILIPWMRMHGNSLFRIDIPDLTIYIFGQTLRIEELYLVLLFSLVLTLAFLLMTMLLGRVWCGWLCPQTTLTDLAEWFADQLGSHGQQRPHTEKLCQKIARQLFYLLLSLLVASNLLWYFIEPHNFFAQLATGQMHYVAWISLLLVAVVIYLDLAFVRRLMCSDFCPYGRIQTTLADQATLTLHLPPSQLHRCIECGSCVRACPMGIDIRKGYQVECINCGRCLDACRQVMAKRNQSGLISYNFGTKGEGPRALLNLRTLLLSLATVALAGTLIIAVYQRPTASLKVSVSHEVASRALKDGNLATFFNAWVNNRSREKTIYNIVARQAETGRPLILKGQTDHLQLAAGENLRIDFVLVTPVPDSRLNVEFILSDIVGTKVAVATAYIKEQDKY